MECFRSPRPTLKLLIPLLLILALSSAGTVLAQEHGHEHGKQGHEEQGHKGHGHEKHGHKGHGHKGHGHGHDGHGDLNSPGFHHDFSDVERWSKRFDAADRPDWQKPQDVVRLMGLTSGMAVADLGAGTGFFLPYLAAAVGAEGKVLGLDVAQSLVDHMNGRAKEAGLSQVEARLIPTDSPGLDAASVDRVVIVNTWHHIDARSDYSAELLKTLKPGGAVYVVDYTLESEEGPPKGHRLAPERVVAELEGGGFKAEIMEETLPRQYVVRGTRP